MLRQIVRDKIVAGKKKDKYIWEMVYTNKNYVDFIQQIAMKEIINSIIKGHADEEYFGVFFESEIEFNLMANPTKVPQAPNILAFRVMNMSTKKYVYYKVDPKYLAEKKAEKASLQNNNL